MVSTIGKHSGTTTPSGRLKFVVKETKRKSECGMLVRPGSSGGYKSEYLDPMFDRGVEPNAQNMLVARELPTINDGPLPAKSRWGGNEHHFARLPELLRNHLDPKSADIFRGNDFKNSRLVKAGDPQKLV